MMIGLPGQTVVGVQRDLEILNRIKPDAVEYIRHEIVNPSVISLYNEHPDFLVRDDDLFNDLPVFFQEGLLTERDSHGNFQFSQVKTEQVLMGLVNDYLNILKENGSYKIGIEKSIAGRSYA